MAAGGAGACAAALAPAVLLLLCAAARPAVAQVPKHCKNATLSYDISFVGPMKRVQVGPVNYGYHRFGPLRPGVTAANAKLPPLVMMSGIGTYMYIHPIPLLQANAADREVIIFDHMRVGASANDSSASSAPLTIPLMAKSSTDFIAALKLPRKPDLYGWSLGGAVVAAMAALHSAAFRHGVIVNGWAGGDRSYVMPERSLKDFLAIRNNVTNYLNFMFPGGAQDDGVCALYAAWNSFYTGKFDKLVVPMSNDALVAQFEAKEASLRDNSVLNALPRSRNRLLVFAGTRDRVVPVRNAAVIADPVPGSWVLRFADEGHGLPFEDPKSVIYLSAEFWGFAVPLQEGDFEGLKYGVLASAAPPASRNATAAGLRATVPAPAAAAAASKADARLLPMLKPKAAPPAGGAPG